MAHNLSVNAYFRQFAKSHQPRHRFDATTPESWQQWRQALRPASIAALGPMPEKVPLEAMIEKEWIEDGLLKRRVLFAVEQGLSAAAYVFQPAGATTKLPAILACHGHGQFGKDSVMGLATRPEIAAEIAALNYNYGLRMAQAGFVTIAIDWRGFGERDDRHSESFADLVGGRDLCNVHFIRASLLGRTLLGMNVNDGQRALDYLTTLDVVDSDRIGVMGLSFGGTMAMWMAIVDERIKAADVICYSERFADFAIERTNFCGSQMAPGLFALGDVADLQGLIAPRPLLIEIGRNDRCFLIEPAMSCYRELERIYSVAGAADRLQLDLFDGGHQWGGNKSVAFFRKYL